MSGCEILFLFSPVATESANLPCSLSVLVSFFQCPSWAFDYCFIGNSLTNEFVVENWEASSKHKTFPVKLTFLRVRPRHL